MLQKLLESQIFLYTLTGFFIVGLAVMQGIAWKIRKKVTDRKSYQALSHRFRTVAWISGGLSLLSMLLALVAVLQAKAPVSQVILYIGLGAGAVVLLAAFDKYLCFSTLTSVVGDYMLDMIGRKNRDKTVDKVLAPAVKKEKQVDKVMKGIQETAASGDSRFSRLMTPEEEAVMRDVIREFMA